MSESIDAALDFYLSACEREYRAWTRLEEARDALVATLQEAREDNPSPDDLTLIEMAERDIARIDQKIRDYREGWKGKETVP